MRAVDREIDVALLGLGGDAGGGAGAHDIDQHQRNFGGDRQPERFDHQGETRPRRDRHCRRAAIGCAERHVDGREFVFAEHQAAAELGEMR